MVDEFHYIQRKILSDLLFNPTVNFTKLKPGGMENSLFNFHLRKLIDQGLVEKRAEQDYALTPSGKNVANSFDADSQAPRKQAKHSAVFCAFRQTGEGLETLIYTRKKSPFYDHQGYPTGKVKYGESMQTTAERELFEEANLHGEAKLIGIRHFRVYYPTPEDLVEDKVMYIYRIDDPTGELQNNPEGEFYWVPVSKIAEVVSNPLPEFAEIHEMLMSYDGNLTFAENNHYPDSF